MHNDLCHLFYVRLQTLDLSQWRPSPHYIDLAKSAAFVNHRNPWHIGSNCLDTMWPSDKDEHRSLARELIKPECAQCGHRTKMSTEVWPGNHRIRNRRVQAQHYRRLQRHWRSTSMTTTTRWQWRTQRTRRNTLRNYSEHEVRCKNFVSSPAASSRSADARKGGRSNGW